MAWCGKCKATENLMKQAKNRDGSYSYVCRACNLKRHRKFTSTEKGKQSVRQSSRVSRLKFPEKWIARKLVNLAIKSGKLCKNEFCGDCLLKTKLFGHHPDYTKPLEVVWLCQMCHVARHKQ